VAIKSIWDGTKVNWVDFLVKEMMVCKHEVKGALGFQPYIMAFVKSKACLQGIEEVVHKSFHPHFNDKDFFMGGLPQPQAPLAEGGESSARGGARGHMRGAGAIDQSSWVPPDGYFDPYFEGIHTHVHDMIALMVGNFDQRFEHEWCWYFLCSSRIFRKRTEYRYSISPRSIPRYRIYP